MKQRNYTLLSSITASFGCADKPAEKHCCLICYARKTLFWRKNKLKSMNYKPDEHDLHFYSYTFCIWIKIPIPVTQSWRDLIGLIFLVV
jgi:hypothetical protein